MRKKRSAFEPFAAKADCFHEQGFGKAALGADATHNAFMKHVIKPWYRCHQAWRYFLQIGANLFGRFAIPNL